MKKNITIGITSSLLLILNYIEGGLFDLFFPNNEWIIQLNETIGRLIFSISIIGFYYSLSKYFGKYGKKIEIRILNSLIIVEFVSALLHGTQYYFGIIPEFVITIFYLSAVILFIVFGIKVLNIKDEHFFNLMNLKSFVISMFIAFGLVIISLAILIFNQKIELINVAFSIYALPYILGLVFFLKINKQPAVNK